MSNSVETGLAAVGLRVLFTDREEWLKYKDGRIGGSSIATLLGLNKYETPYQLWEKMIGRTPPFEGNAATERGHILEPAIAEWICKEKGWEIEPDSVEDFVYQHEEHPFIIGSPDRIAFDYTGDQGEEEDRRRVIEIKSTRMSITPDTVPDYWVVQINHYMGLSGIHNGVIAWINGNLEFQSLDVEFSQELFDAGINAAVDFMMDHVYSKIEPDVTTGEDAASRFPVPVDGKAIEATDGVRELIHEIGVLRKIKKDHEDNLKAKEDQLKVLMGDAEMVTYLGDKIATYKYTKGRKSFDSKAFKEDYPELYNEYERESSGYRTLRLTEK